MKTRNLLVKVTVPRRTGRKRKRGTNDPFIEEDPKDQGDSITAPDIVNHLRDNDSNYTIEPVGIISETHRFRGLPDFQVRSSELPIMREIRDHGMELNYDILTKFNVPLTPNAEGIDAFPPPPNFMNLDQPYRYDYQQATGLIFKTDAAGNPVTENTTAPAKRLVKPIDPEEPTVPSKPSSDLPPLSTLSPILQSAITRLQEILQARPLATRRYLVNVLALNGYNETLFKEATQYAGYSFRAGPFRDCLITYGIDPRKDPKYRFYQTVMFQTDTEWSKKPGGQEHRSLYRPFSNPTAAPGELETSHIFDGDHVSSNGKTWQICDITDPQLHDLIHTSNLPSECDAAGWGWYYNGTMGKLRVVMKNKIKRLLSNSDALSHTEYEYILSFPDRIRGRADMEETQLEEKIVGRAAMQMALDFRSMISRGTGSKQSGLGQLMVGGEAAGVEDVGAGADEVDEDEGGDFEAMEDDEDDAGPPAASQGAD